MLVIGGGIAGLSAAIAAAGRGADVVLVDDDVEPGGALLAEGGHERVRALAGEARAAGVEILSKAPALGFYDGLVPVWQGDTLHQIRARRHVAATGAIEQPLVFKDNDLPGVMMSGGARRLAALWAVRPGTAAVVATTGDRGLDAALALRAAGVEIAAVADLRPDAAERELGAAVQAAGIRLLAGMTVVRALGRSGVSGAVLARVDPSGKATGTLEEVPCDLLAVSAGTAPATSLLLQSGAKARYDAATSRFLAAVPEGIVHAAGAVAGHEDADAAASSGTAAGLDAAVALGLGGATAKRALTNERKRLDALPAQSPVAAPPAYARDGRRGGKAFVDLDEDITTKDIAYSVAEGYDSIELSKRYTTVTMGPSQGRHSQLASIRVLAAVTGRSLDDVGITTARPPWSTVPMGALAGRPFEPAKRSAMHARHRELGATVKWAGDWRRAYDYGDPEGEAQAVHRAAGLIDVSTLGKLLVRGPDAGAFLDRLYPNRVSNLKPGRIRYGVLTSETGRITDDGTIARLDDETFYVTTTSSGAGAVHNWFTWWLADWRMRVHITDVTQASAAMNLAGPRSREILQSLTDADVSAEGMTLPRRAPRAGRGRVLPRAADRLHRRAGLRDPLPGAARAGPLGRGHGGRRRARHPALRPGAAAHPATAEAPHPRRAGHRLGVDAVRRRDAVDRQARQGRGLHRALGAGARGGASGADGPRRLLPARRGRARRGRGRPGRGGRAHRPGHQRASQPPGRQGHRHGLGAGPASHRRRPCDDLLRRAHLRRDGRRPARSTIPRGPWCAHEPRLPRPVAEARRRPPRARRAQPHGGHRGHRGRDARAPRRLERRRRFDAPRGDRRLRRRLASAQDGDPGRRRRHTGRHGDPGRRRLALRAHPRPGRS